MHRGLDETRPPQSHASHQTPLSQVTSKRWKDMYVSLHTCDTCCVCVGVCACFFTSGTCQVAVGAREVFASVRFRRETMPISPVLHISSIGKHNVRHLQNIRRTKNMGCVKPNKVPSSLPHDSAGQTGKSNFRTLHCLDPIKIWTVDRRGWA